MVLLVPIVMLIEIKLLHHQIDQRNEIDGMPAIKGRMNPPSSVLDSFGENLPEALHLMGEHGSRFTFTTETPSGQPITDRMRAQESVVCTLLKAFLSEYQ